MKNKIFALSIIFVLAACGGSGSSGDTAPLPPESSASDSSNNDCTVVNNIITIAKGASCDLTADIVSTYNLNNLSITTSSMIGCDAEGKLTVGTLTSDSGSATLNSLSFLCAS